MLNLADSDAIEGELLRWAEVLKSVHVPFSLRARGAEEIHAAPLSLVLCRTFVRISISFVIFVFVKERFRDH